MIRGVLAACVLIAGLSQPVFASPRDDLRDTQAEIEKSRTRQKELAQENKKLAQELKSLQQQLVRAAADIQRVEKELLAAEDKLADIAQQYAEKEASLAENKERLEVMVQAALRLARMPPEAMVMMPGDMREHMQASRALKMISDEIKAETEQLSTQMAELQVLEQAVKKNREEVSKRRTLLENERKELDGKLDERKELQKKLASEQKEEAAKSAKLAKQAKTLQELLARLDKEAVERQKAREEAETDKGLFEHASKGKMRSFARAKGRIRLPAVGRIKEHYGETLKNGSASKGVMLETQHEAQVVAPYDGEVVFSGPFLNYGRMVILRHSDDFHTLIAGLSELSTRPGEFLLEGEPIGAMGSSASQTKLYLELRKQNQPVNPNGWIKGLKN